MLLRQCAMQTQSPLSLFLPQLWYIHIDADTKCDDTSRVWNYFMFLITRCRTFIWFGRFRYFFSLLPEVIACAHLLITHVANKQPAVWVKAEYISSFLVFYSVVAFVLPQKFSTRRTTQTTNRQRWWDTFDHQNENDKIYVSNYTKVCTRVWGNRVGRISEWIRNAGEMAEWMVSLKILAFLLLMTAFDALWISKIQSSRLESVGNESVDNTFDWERLFSDWDRSHIESHAGRT